MRDHEKVDEEAGARTAVARMAALCKWPVGPNSALEEPRQVERLGGSIQAAEEPIQRLTQFGALFGAHESMLAVFSRVAKVAPSVASVLILGESGTGKELVATTIHDLSARRDCTFVAVNCGAITENLIESELFGHEKGSFTGALRTHEGCFERAKGGTLFLDEITEMSLEMQARLLRVLESGQFSRVGGEGDIAADVRVIAATNRDPAEAVVEGKLREDLYFRLSVIPIYLPPLRERGCDVTLLAAHFLHEMNCNAGTTKKLLRGARAELRDYGWPGNVRELRNVLQRSFVLSDGVIELQLDNALNQARRGVATAGGDTLIIPIGTSLESAQRSLIMATLHAVNGSKSKAAAILGVSLKTLYNRLHAYGEPLDRRLRVA
ncbi:MAG: sigma-54-dependent Fis family transcriptional regulator [Betaproteobacteria bacterium]|nr:sigma-54-dependent Fis family transcriptional regulator [Betaproteobacteria bacterium]